MAKTTTPRSGAKTATRTRTAASTSTAAKAATPKATASTRPKDDSLVARTGRTIKERPYTSAAIATGAVGVVAAAAAAAGAFLVSRRDKSFKEATGELSTKVKGGVSSAAEAVKGSFASASETVKDGLASASDTVRGLGQSGADYFKGDGNETGADTGSETRSQREIAEEALTLKATGAANNPAEELAATELKAGAISY